MINLKHFSPAKSQQKFFDLFPLQLKPPKPIDHRYIELHGEMCGKSTCAAIWLLLQSHWYPEKKGLIFSKYHRILETVEYWAEKCDMADRVAMGSVFWDFVSDETDPLDDIKFDYIVIDEAGYLDPRDFRFIDRVLGDRGQILMTVGRQRKNWVLNRWSETKKSVVIDINLGENSWVTE